MKHLARAALKLVAVLTPTLWACGPDMVAVYGVPVRMVKGRVVARPSQVPVPGIAVSCLQGSPPSVGTATTTDASGQFSLEDYNCSTIRAEDVDGPANGGPYRTATIEVDRSDDYVTIELDE